MSENDDGRFNTPEGRLINSALFEKSTYTDPKTKTASTPSYNVEMAFEWDDVNGDGTIEDNVIDALVEQYGEDILDDYDEGSIRTPFLDGDKLAKKRERKGKEGDAYKGLCVIRAKTFFNSDGEDGPGGIDVYDENVDLIPAEKKATVYNGSMGVATLTANVYEDNNGDPAVNFYLKAYQKTGDGEKLRSGANTAAAFKPVGGGKKRERRRSRRGNDD